MVVLAVSPRWSLAVNTTLWLPAENPDCTFIINGHSPVVKIITQLQHNVYSL